MKSKPIKPFFFKKTFLFKHWPLILASFIFALLLAKNPFSDRTLIPNFEPFPDTFYYIVTPRCWLEGGGWKLCRPEMISGIESSVAPLYSIALLPFFALNSDPRTFYFGNLVFSLIGLGIFYLILKKIFSPTAAPLKNKFSSQLLIFFSLFIYATSYHLYWYPTLAMASNLLLPLFMVGLYLLLIPISIPAIIIAIPLGISFVATKFSAIPLTLTFLSIYFVRIFLKYKNNKKLLIKIVSFSVLGIFLFSALTKFKFIGDIFKMSYKVLFINDETDWFALAHFPKNLDFYLKTLLGQKSKVLWDFNPFYPIWMGVGAGIGFIWALIKKQGLALSALLLLASQVVFMSLFYDHDGRYIFIALPVIFLGFAYFLKFSLNKFEKINHQRYLFNGRNIFLIFISLIFLIFSFNNFAKIKSQVSLNLKYAERPWYYLSVLEFNNFFAQLYPEKKPILISPVAPFLIDFYSNGNYSLLPLSTLQEFRGQKEAVWGGNDYTDLVKLYKLKLDQGFEVYVTNYGIGNIGYQHQSFSYIKQNFSLTKVQSGCYDQCNLYKLSL